MNYCQIDRKDSIETWTINRPERSNAIGTSLALELKQHLDRLKRDLDMWINGDHTLEPCVKILVLKTNPQPSSDPIWMAGGDLKELAQIKDKSEARRYAQTMIDVCCGFEDLAIPVFAVIDGRTIGGGVEFALAADLRIATDRSSFEFKQLKVGLATGYGGASRIVSLLGLSRAKGLLFGSETITAEEAFRLGIVHKLCKKNDLEIMLTQYLSHFKGLSSLSLYHQKRMLHLQREKSFSECQKEELNLFEKLWRNPHHEAFLKSFLERKK